LCSAAISLNFIPLFMFKEPRHQGEGSDWNPGQVLWGAIKGLLEPRLFFFTISFAGFWLMFYQLFDILPNFIDDWIDSRALAASAERMSVGLLGIVVLGVIALGRMVILRSEDRRMSGIEKAVYLGLGGLLLIAVLATRLSGGAMTLGVPTINGGNMTQEWMINVNAFFISIIAFFIGWLTGKVRSLQAIVIGIAISAVAIYALGMSMNGWWTLGAILLFSLGEMSASPTKMRYLAAIAPKGKEGLYMGYVNFTVGIGWSIGSIIAGNMYQEGGDKVELARKYLVEEQGMAQEAAMAIDRAEVMDVFQGEVGVDAFEAREVLWEAYQPYDMWLVFTLIGLASMLGIIIYDKVTRAAAANPGHAFNVKGGQIVTVALAPIAAAFWWYFWELTANQGKGLDEALAVIVQAVMFTGMFLISLFSPYKDPGTGAPAASDAD
ncbi:MAG: MFS transporter, partial [Synechococcaceae cyanobacterium]|nr:MFS transporter [Synechococcaceae cyanobacterium]